MHKRCQENAIVFYKMCKRFCEDGRWDLLDGPLLIPQIKILSAFKRFFSFLFFSFRFFFYYEYEIIECQTTGKNFIKCPLNDYECIWTQKGSISSCSDMKKYCTRRNDRNTTLEHCLCSLDQMSTDFYLLPREKMKLKEIRFAIWDEIM